MGRERKIHRTCLQTSILASIDKSWLTMSKINEEYISTSQSNSLTRNQSLQFISFSVEFMNFLNSFPCIVADETHTSSNKYSVNSAILTPSHGHKLLKFHKHDTTWLFLSIECLSLQVFFLLFCTSHKNVLSQQQFFYQTAPSVSLSSLGFFHWGNNISRHNKNVVFFLLSCVGCDLLNFFMISFLFRVIFFFILAAVFYSRINPLRCSFDFTLEPQYLNHHLKYDYDTFRLKNSKRND